MKVTHHSIIAFGIAMLLMVPIVKPLIEPSHSLVYHLDGPSSTIFYPVIVCIAVLWLLLTALLTLAKRPGRTRLFVWTVILGMLPWVVLKDGGIIFSRYVQHRLSLLVFLAGLVTAIALLACWKTSFQRSFDRAQEFAATLLAFFAISSLLILGQLGWCMWQTRSMEASLPLHQRADALKTASHSVPQPIPHPRIIWLILDELSYRQIYEHRFPGLQLPAFDRLATQSSIFTQVEPAGFTTEYAVPSLISGIPANAMRASSDGRKLSLFNPVQQRWNAFDPHQTIFQDALDRGYSTGISGWFNPYCRILSQVLDHCFWTSHYSIPGGMSREQTLFANALAPLHDVLNSARQFVYWRKRVSYLDEAAAQFHIQDYRDLFAAADTMLNDSSADFLCLHMPIPHPGGIYNRRTSQFTTGPSTYLDNLALADTYLAHLRSQLEQRGEWDSSTILIMGDHSWRTAPIWAWDPSWSVEEQNASNGGQFDDRPAYILKLPHQQQSTHIDVPYPAVRTRALLDALIDQRIQSPQDLSDWVINQPAPPLAISLAK